MGYFYGYLKTFVLSVMKKNFYVLFMLLSGVFLFPETTSACEKMPEESAEACEMDNAEDSEKITSCDRDCCKKADGSEKASEQKHDCDGSCQGNCHQVITHFNFVLPATISGISHNPDFFFRKDNFHTSKIQPSSGFYFIWTPPNINS